MLICPDVLSPLSAATGAAHEFMLNDDWGIFDELRPDPHHGSGAGRAVRSFEVLHGLS